MSFQQVELVNFRSYPKSKFSFDAATTIIIGPNGSGKTNILEALYLLSTGKSFRAADPELLRHKKDWFKVVGQTRVGELEVRYEQANQNPKKILHKNQPVKMMDYIGQLPVVLFEPEDLAIVNGAPARRRRFIDAILSVTDKKYFEALLTYRRILKQRNSLLKSGSRAREQIFAWDIKLAELADYIVKARHKLAKYLNKNINERYKAISNKKADITIAYDSNVEIKDYTTKLLEKLERSLPRDLALGFTTAGPHRDDLKVLFGGASADYSASRGETRTLVLALKQLEQEYIADKQGRLPVLLLDDVFSELDETRQDYLLKNLAGEQTIITTTDINRIKSNRLKDYNVLDLSKKR